MARTLPRKSISTSSALRRPIFRPRKKAPSGLSAIGIDGWPILPRTGSCRSSRPSSSSSRMMTETVCAESLVMRAISVLARLPCWRTSDSTRRSLWSRMPLWLVPRWKRLSADSGEPCLETAGLHPTSSSFPACFCGKNAYRGGCCQ